LDDPIGFRWVLATPKGNKVVEARSELMVPEERRRFILQTDAGQMKPLL
jgi:hypothetical protein